MPKVFGSPHSFRLLPAPVAQAPASPQPLIVAFGSHSTTWSPPPVPALQVPAGTHADCTTFPVPMFAQHSSVAAQFALLEHLRPMTSGPPPPAPGQLPLGPTTQRKLGPPVTGRAIGS